MLNNKSNFYSNIVIAFVSVFSFLATPFFVNWQQYHHPFIMDINQYYSYLIALFVEHDLGFSTNTHNYWLMETPIHQVVPKVTYGVAFFYSPFFLLSNLFSSANATGYESIYAWVIHYGCIIYILIGLWYLKKNLLVWFNDFVVSVTLVLVFFGTNLFYYTVSESESVHGILFFLISIFLYHVNNWYQTKSRKSFLIFMICAGFICLIRPTECLILLLPALIGLNSLLDIKFKLKQIISLKWYLLLGILLFCLPIIPQLIYWKIQSGNFLFFSYGSAEGFFWDDPQIINVFFSFRKGLFVYTPILVFSIIGFVIMQKRNKNLFYPVLLYFIINAYLVCCWWDWAYGGSFGMRAFIHCYVILSLPLAYFFNWLIGLYKISQVKTIFVYCFSILLSLLCILNVLQSNLYKHGIIHYDGMTKEAYMFTFFKKKYSEVDLIHLKTLIKEPNYSERRKGNRYD